MSTVAIGKEGTEMVTGPVDHLILVEMVRDVMDEVGITYHEAQIKSTYTPLSCMAFKKQAKVLLFILKVKLNQTFPISLCT